MAYKETIEYLPSAQPDRKTGRWIAEEVENTDGSHTFYSKCSECGEYEIIEFNYCPNCGAKMMEVKHE